MKKLFLTVLLLSLLFASQVFAAGSSCTLTEANASDDGKVKMVTVAWVGDTSDGTVPTCDTRGLHGFVLKVCTDITLSASIDYDIALLDTSTGDIMGAELADRNTTASECVSPNPPRRIDGVMTFSLSGNSDTSSSGTVFISVLVD